MTFCKSLNGPIIGKCFLTQILTNRPKKLYFQEKKVQVHPAINFNNITVERTSYQKHLGILLNEKLNCQQHIDSVIPKINKGISVINKRRHSLPRKSLLIKYKAFFKASNWLWRYHLWSTSKCEKLESVQYKAALAITGVMQGTFLAIKYIKN